MTCIGEELLGRVAALEAREKSNARRTLRLGLICVGLFVAAVGADHLALYLGFVAPSWSIDVPANIMALFGVTTPDGQLSMVDHLIDYVLLLWEVTLALLLPAAVVIAGVCALFVSRKAAKNPIRVALLLGLSVMLLALGPWNDAQRIRRRDFVRAVEMYRFEEVAGYLKEVDQGTTPAGLYVLVQVSIAEKRNRLPVSEDLIREMFSPSAGFTPKGLALYNIERALYGSPKSAAARAYQHGLKARGPMDIVTGILALSGLIIFLLALGQGLLYCAVRRRVRRVRRLLGPHLSP